MEPISVFPAGSPEHAKLSDAARRVAEASGLDCRVEDVYYDYGQNWRCTTLIGYPSGGSPGVQILNPKEQRDVLYGEEDAFHDAVSSAVKSLIDLYRGELAAKAAAAARRAERMEK